MVFWETWMYFFNINFQKPTEEKYILKGILNGDTGEEGLKGRYLVEN